MSTIDYLSIGHCCHDVKDDGFILGGSASYGGIIAKKLGRNAAIVTSYGPDFLFEDVFTEAKIPLHTVSAQKTTVFNNVYNGAKRTQYMLARANTIVSADIPRNLLDASIVHLNLIADEIDYSLIAEFKSSLVGATIQGAIRQWDENGLITPRAMEWTNLNNVDLVILSKDDIKGVEHFLPEIIANTSQVVVTAGADGATVYKDQKEYFFPAFPVTEVEATGAGDVFTTAYLIQYQKTKDIESACVFAHCAASFIIEGIGLENIPTTEEIELRMQQYQL